MASNRSAAGGKRMQRTTMLAAAKRRRPVIRLRRSTLRHVSPLVGRTSYFRPAPQFAPPGALRSVVLPATRQSRDTNPSIFEGLRRKPGRLELGIMRLEIVAAKSCVQFRPKIQVGRCPRLPDGQNLALNHCKSPNSRPKYRPDFPRFLWPWGLTRSRLGCCGRGLGCGEGSGAGAVGHICRKQHGALPQQLALYRCFRARDEHKGGLAAIAVGKPSAPCSVTSRCQ